MTERNILTFELLEENAIHKRHVACATIRITA